MNILYSDPGCAPCRTMKYLLTKKGIDYEEREATQYPQELIKLTGQTHPPVFVTNGRVITQPSQLSGLTS